MLLTGFHGVTDVAASCHGCICTLTVSLAEVGGPFHEMVLYLAFMHFSLLEGTVVMLGMIKEDETA